jgi:hypothetical protein
MSALASFEHRAMNARRRRAGAVAGIALCQ